MNNIIDIVLIAGFLVADFLFFHDFFKAGEVITMPIYLVGILSIVVIYRSARSLFAI